MKPYQVSFVGRKSGAIGIFYLITEEYTADTEIEAREKCLNDTRYELNYIIHITDAFERISNEKLRLILAGNILRSMGWMS